MSEGRAHVLPAGEGYLEVTADVAAKGRAEIIETRSVGQDGRSSFVSTVQRNLGRTGQTVFYRFVCSLLTALGLPARLSNTGDTSQRMDAVCTHPANSVPVEIKSPTEVAAADLKSVRQALENHVIMRGRRTDPTSADTATFAIGHEPLAERSDARELADDIEETYGVKVRVFSTWWLLQQLVERAVGGRMLDGDAMRVGNIRE
jgi:hypothetical protein